MLSCIVPVYNNQDTLRHVLSVLSSCQDIDELVVVDDGSRDASPALLAEFTGLTALFNPTNLGKGGAVVRGIRRARGDTLLLCDADLATLQMVHIKCLIDEHRNGKYDMVIAGRAGGSYWAHRMNMVSGERILQRSAIEPYLELIASHGNGIEQIINFAHRDRRVKCIVNHGVGHVLKYQRGGMHQYIPAYAKEIGQLIQTELVLRRMAGKAGFLDTIHRLQRGFISRQM